MKRTPLIFAIELALTLFCDKNSFGKVKLLNAKLSLSRQALVPPHFPGGEDAFHLYLGKNLKWPKTEDGDSQGIVIISFFVEKDGTLTNFQVAKSLGKAFDDEALRVIRASPKWIPAMRDGKAIKSKYTAPIKFYIGD